MKTLIIQGCTQGRFYLKKKKTIKNWNRVDGVSTLKHPFDVWICCVERHQTQSLYRWHACQTIHIVFLWIQIHLSIIISYPPSIHLSTTYTVSRDQEQLKAMPYKHINFYHFFFLYENIKRNKRHNNSLQNIGNKTYHGMNCHFQITHPSVLSAQKIKTFSQD